ncbi:MAG: hypothetical protein K0R75_3391, partial [Paenibacillaceae bacterium]|nr:hypothetical protein [Paenibacillaceae bacterium]
MERMKRKAARARMEPLEDTDDLQQLKHIYHQVAAPDYIDHTIRRGVVRGKEKISRSKRRYRLTGIATAALIVIFLATVHFSPAFAAYMEKIPVLQYFSRYFKPDAGLLIAAEQGYKQHIGKSVEHEGIRFTVDDLIVDEARMIVFYTITDKNGYDNIRFDARWSDAATGQELPRGAQVGMNGDSIHSGPTQTGTVEVDWKEDTPIPNKVDLSLNIYVPIKPGYAKMIPLDKQWNVSFKIDANQIIPKQVYDINQTVDLAGQKVTFLQASLLPTAIRVEFSIDPNNSKQIFSIEDLRLVDDTGTVWNPTQVYDPIRTSYVNEVMRPTEKHAIYFEGSLLAKPKSLEIVGSTIRALDKNKREVLVDTHEQKLLKAPDDRIKLFSVQSYPQEIDIAFELPKEKDKASPLIIRLGMIHTREESWLHLKNYGGCGGSSYSKEEKQELRCTYKGSELMGEYLTDPLIFRIYDYGYDKIYQPFRVR